MFSGKHKQNFFESLHKLVLSYLNHLIQDGVAALQIEPHSPTDHAPPQRSYSTSSETSQYNFHFLQNIPEAMKYITEQIVELRKYLAYKGSSVENDSVDGSKQQKTHNVTTVCILQFTI